MRRFTLFAILLLSLPAPASAQTAPEPAEAPREVGAVSEAEAGDDDLPLKPVPRRHHPKATLRPVSTPARWIFEDSSARYRPQQLSFVLGSPIDSLSAGMWYAFPVLTNGFLQEINNAVYVEVGALVSSNFTANTYATLSGGARWNFYLTSNWALFAALRVNFNVGLSASERLFFVLPDLSMGALYRLSRATRLRLELGFPTGLGVGILLQF
jgi:hypothetical protein